MKRLSLFALLALVLSAVPASACGHALAFRAFAVPVAVPVFTPAALVTPYASASLVQAAPAFAAEATPVAVAPVAVAPAAPVVLAATPVVATSVFAAVRVRRVAAFRRVFFRRGVLARRAFAVGPRLGLRRGALRIGPRFGGRAFVRPRARVLRRR